MTEQVPGVKNGVIVDASYWLWVDAKRKELAEAQAAKDWDAECECDDDR